ncbi:MAG: PAS domain S-box protein [Bacteroidales bacterium]
MTRFLSSREHQTKSIQNLREALKRERHLKRVLKGVRNVNQLIAKETDPERLISQACSSLTETLGYLHAWIALTDESGKVSLFASSKKGLRLADLDQYLKQGKQPSCMKEALKTAQLVVFSAPSNDCLDCPFGAITASNAGLCSPIGYRGKTYGVLAASAPATYAHLEEEQSIFMEVAEDLGFALYTIERENQRSTLEHHLKERVKELQCLTSINDNMHRELTEDAFCRQLETHISIAMQYPEATRVIVLVEGRYASDKPAVDISEYPGIRADIAINGQGIGYIQVLYTDQQLVFLPEEDKLLRNAARLTGLFFQRREAIAKIQEQRENLRITLQSIGDGVITTDVEGLVTNMNPIAEKMTAWPLKEALHKPLDEVFRIVNARTKKIAGNPARKVLKKGKIVGMANDTVLIARDGTEYQIADSAAPIKDTEGIISGVVMVFSDVTDKYRQQQALQESEKRHRALFENASDGILLISEKGIEDCNYQATKLFKCSKEELLGQTLWEISPSHQPDGKPSKDKASKLIQKTLAGEHHHVEWKHQTYEGNPFDTEISLSLVHSNGKDFVLSIVRDISKRKQDEATRKVLYQVASATLSNETTGALIASIRDSLSLLMDTSNFFIALYDDATGILSIPYEESEEEKIKQFQAEGSLTGLIIAEKQSMLLTQTNIEQLISEGKVQMIGSMCKVWLGVPLIVRKKIIGVVVIQDYNNPDAIDKNHKQLLEYVSNQISIAIQRAKNIQDLTVAKERAEESDKLKSAFLNNLSHEIRTPLNAIMGFSEILSEGAQSPDRVKELTRVINHSGAQLLSIIDDIISMSSIETGLIEPDEKTTDVNELLNDVLIQMEPIAREKPIKFRLNNMLTAEQACTITDQTKVTQTLTNLVHNAIKYTTKGHVEFGCRYEQGELLFYVADTGIGIKQEEQQAIWECFQQSNPMPSGKKSGIGLGLAISRSFVRMLGGEIWMESEVGKGSIFHFSIPYKACNSRPKMNKQLKNNPLSQKAKVLVAEDERHNFELTNTILKTYDVEVLHAWNGEEAVAIFKKDKDIDLVLMDIKMPVLNGLKATREIKQLRPHIPVIAMTAYAQKGDKDKALDAGCDDYLPKPISIDHFMGVIQRHLGFKETETN